MGVFLRNPDRNLGIFLNLDRVEREGDALKFIGRFFRRPQEQVMLEGIYHPDADQISVFFGAFRGGTYDFTRVDDDEASGFYARGKNPEPWVYRPPSSEDGGWATGSLEEAGIQAGPLKEMIERKSIRRPRASTPTTCTEC